MEVYNGKGPSFLKMKVPSFFWWLAYIIMPTIVGSIIVDCRWHDLMTNKIIHNRLKGVLESQLGDKKIGMCKRPKRLFWEKLHKQKYYTRFFLNTYFLLIHMLAFITLDLSWTFLRKFHNIKFNKKVKTHYGDPLRALFHLLLKVYFV
jgi:hypothetical protein